MPLNDAVPELRGYPPVRSVSDAVPLVNATVRLQRPGVATLVFFDRRRRLADLLAVEDGDTADLPRTVGMACCLMPRKVKSLLIVTDRSGEVPADRPGDEELWEEILDLTNIVDITVLDWLVSWGTKAFSVAQFAPRPANW
jgi:hypothetical protein